MYISVRVCVCVYAAFVAGLECQAAASKLFQAAKKRGMPEPR